MIYIVFVNGAIAETGPFTYTTDEQMSQFVKDKKLKYSKEDIDVVDVCFE